jgi:hypothetical protein
MNDLDVDTAGLVPVDGFSFPVFSSRGGVDRARTVATRSEQAISWLASRLEMPPTPPLLVVGRQDWDRVALIPQYGLPHVSRTRMLMGQEPSEMWDSVIATAWPDLSHAARVRLRQVYGTPPDLGSFADLLVAHELTHLADNPAWLDEQRPGSEHAWGNNPRVLWFVELFANVGLHGYIAEREPDALPALETIFDVVWHTSPARWPITELSRMHEAATAENSDGTNYVWFEFGLQVLAKHLWESSGTTALTHLNATLHGPVLPDEQIIDVLGELSPAAADNVRAWPSMRGFSSQEMTER